MVTYIPEVTSENAVVVYSFISAFPFQEKRIVLQAFLISIPTSVGSFIYVMAPYLGIPLAYVWMTTLLWHTCGGRLLCTVIQLGGSLK